MSYWKKIIIVLANTRSAVPAGTAVARKNWNMQTQDT